MRQHDGLASSKLPANKDERLRVGFNQNRNVEHTRATFEANVEVRARLAARLSLRTSAGAGARTTTLTANSSSITPHTSQLTTHNNHGPDPTPTPDPQSRPCLGRGTVEAAQATLTLYDRMMRWQQIRWAVTGWIRDRMLRYNPRRSSKGHAGLPATKDGTRLPLRRMSRKISRRPCRISLKKIVAIQAVVLVLLWLTFSGRLLAVWNGHTPPAKNRPSRLRSYLNSLTIQKRGYRGPFHEVHGGRGRTSLNQSLISQRMKNYKGPTLVIGGSDGSGTRAFASIMRDLGVPLWTEDKETLDVHGSIMFKKNGWPPLASLVLNATHSANYEVQQLSNETLTTAMKELTRLKERAAIFEMKHSRNEAKLRLSDPSRPNVTKVMAGFKAPVTMVLVPLLKEVFGPIKYLHVVRDGRDVAVSSNKSPVEKFYQSMYADADARMAKHSNTSDPVLAMHLWNDWNTQLLEWEKAHAADKDFDFLVVRSEDLLDPEKKFESLVRMAKFVGSSMTREELCCLSRESAIDMGQSINSRAVFDAGVGVARQQWNQASSTGKHTREAVQATLSKRIAERRQALIDSKVSLGEVAKIKEKVMEEERDSLIAKFNDRIKNISQQAAEGLRKLENSTATVNVHLTVNERYGKWERLLKDKPDVAAELHKEGRKGLAAFGYEPPHSFIMGSYNSPATRSFQCDETVMCDDY